MPQTTSRHKKATVLYDTASRAGVIRDVNTSRDVREIRRPRKPEDPGTATEQQKQTFGDIILKEPGEKLRADVSAAEADLYSAQKATSDKVQGKIDEAEARGNKPVSKHGVMRRILTGAVEALANSPQGQDPLTTLVSAATLGGAFGASSDLEQDYRQNKQKQRLAYEKARIGQETQIDRQQVADKARTVGTLQDARERSERFEQAALMGVLRQRQADAADVRNETSRQNAETSRQRLEFQKAESQVKRNFAEKKYSSIDLPLAQARMKEIEGREQRQKIASHSISFEDSKGIRHSIQVPIFEGDDSRDITERVDEALTASQAKGVAEIPKQPEKPTVGKKSATTKSSSKPVATGKVSTFKF